MCVCVCVCVCVREKERERECVCKRERESVCVCVCVCILWAKSVRSTVFAKKIQGYLSHKKQPSPEDHHRTLGIVLL